MRHHSSFLRQSVVLLTLLSGCGPSGIDPYGESEQAVRICPAGTMIDGADVSHYQSPITWASYAASSFGNFAYAKATQGLTFTDPTFATNWAGMKSNGVHRGAYHYYICTDDPTQQATFFLGVMGTLSSGDLPPAIDLEDTNSCTASNIGGVLTFLSAVQNGSGRLPIVYTYPSFLSGSLPSGLSSYPLWIANYVTLPTCPDVPSPWSNWVFWQYDSATTLTVPGMSCTTNGCDVDHYNGDAKSLNTFTGGAGSPDAGTIPPDAGAIPPDAGSIPPDASVVPPDASVIPSDAAVVPPDAGLGPPDASFVMPDGGFATPDGSVASDGSNSTTSGGCGCGAGGNPGPSLALGFAAILTARRRKQLRARATAS